MQNSAFLFFSEINKSSKEKSRKTMKLEIYWLLWHYVPWARRTPASRIICHRMTSTDSSVSQAAQTYLRVHRDYCIYAHAAPCAWKYRNTRQRVRQLAGISPLASFLQRLRFLVADRTFHLRPFTFFLSFSVTSVSPHSRFLSFSKGVFLADIRKLLGSKRLDPIDVYKRIN